MTPNYQQKRHILQVSELTKKVRFLLESEMRTLWLCGEISNFLAAGSGHWYLSLKDSKAQVRCAMFRGNNRHVRIKPANGQQVLVKAKVTLYEPRGDFQLIIEQMEDAGEGLLRQKFEQLKAQLHQEGLFDQRYKQPIPESIRTVGVITSATGAAVHDILTVMKRRNPGVKVIIYPTLVQGDGAAEQIAETIEVADLRDECDVLIVGRGGGSLEDLWSFNEEVVVRAIFACEIPVISAVGHEVDVSLSDYVADMRAATPSAAAEIVTKDNKALFDKLKHYQQRLSHIAKQKLFGLQRLQERLQHRLALTHPQQQLQKQQQLADDLQQRLSMALLNQLQQKQLRFERLQVQLDKLSPASSLPLNRTRLQVLDNRLRTAMLATQDKSRMALANIAHNLNIVSPLATIARGYSITRDEAGNIIRSVASTDVGREINVQFSDGHVQAKVLNKQSD
ncbi:exodeoxyribonuclease VII large subunit [Thalassotalea sp. PS06]|uniref:exodeoxyribonuclease VII large subunit n=1 Tax=Thalassotalea sp. PS06 TaxID=2594005 RepID=UPI001165C309|nr:exodeoxyribonuclease VII large subunit [Thalassotalea sp. PS06]QDP00393.1 exodeoxyribonuclease VII large subunit [Thalassotalea sp. PS06]